MPIYGESQQLVGLTDFPTVAESSSGSLPEQMKFVGNRVLRVENTYDVHPLTGELPQNYIEALATAWPVANKSLGVPKLLNHPCQFYGIGFVCAVTGGLNYDVGLYDSAGSKLGNKGSTALAVGYNSWTPAAIPLLPGIYYMHLVCSGVGAQIIGVRNAGFAASMALIGMREIPAVALPLPAGPSGLNLSNETYTPLLQFLQA